MKKRIIIIVAVALAVVLAGIGGWFLNGFFGNPISKMLATSTAEKHLEAHYADTDFVLEDVSFNFKDGRYYAHVSSPSSIDSHFSLVLSMSGKLIDDFYENSVLTGQNTADRLDDSYRQSANAILEAPDFLAAEHFGYGELMFVPAEYRDAADTPSYAMLREDLVLDADYDINALGASIGKITLHVDDTTVSVERMAQLLLHTRAAFDEEGVPFYAIDCVLTYPKNDDGTIPSGRVEVIDFCYADIVEDGLVDRVRLANAEAAAHNAELDTQKKAETAV
ncbi:MAG: hypothetical protein IKV35_06180 [Clostridia bacterium]|nr:hypothetical protein [Clostridia bacterium]